MLENIPYGEYLAGYIGNIVLVSYSMAAMFSILVLVVLEMTGDKLNRLVKRIFSVIAWFSLIFILSYWVGSIIHTLIAAGGKS
ncbi:MAG: hypothetical protein JW734_03795 [Candidatus Omnitrophica bacterium]|nr:hypothetical protein [Candidatus Omnitrophota bacterium]